MDPNTITLLIQIGIPVVLLLLGWGFGRIAERRHYKSIHRREDATIEVPITSERRLIPPEREVVEARLLQGSVVVSVDHFKRFLAGLRGLFGGEVQSYSSLLDRARREARLRMIEAWPEADLILNFRFETSSISNGSGSAFGTVEVLAYGTGLRFGESRPEPQQRVAYADLPQQSMAEQELHEIYT